MTAPTAVLVEVEVFVRFSVVLVRFMRVHTRLPWIFDEITAPVEKQFGPSPMDGKAERAADPLRENALALLLGDVEEGKVLGAELFSLGRSFSHFFSTIFALSRPVFSNKEFPPQPRIV